MASKNRIIYDCYNDIDRILLTNTRSHGDHSGEPGTIPVHFILKDNTVKDTLARYVANNLDPVRNIIYERI